MCGRLHLHFDAWNLSFKRLCGSSKNQNTYELVSCGSQIFDFDFKMNYISIPAAQFGIQIGVMVFQHFNLDSKLGWWFSSISIWIPNWGGGFPAFQFGFQIGVVVFQHFNLDSKLGWWFSSISIWIPNWGGSFPAF